MKTWKRALALVLALVMALSLVALPSFAAGEEESAGDTGMPYIKDQGGKVEKDGLVMSKTIKKGENGQFLLTLEAYATGSTTTTTSTKPMDIVLVLDVSGSMGERINGSGSQYKIDVLKSAVNGFIDKVAEKSPNSSIAVVKFAGDEKTETGNDKYRDWGDYYYNYSQTVIDLTAAGTGAAALKDAVNALDPDGSTAADYGMNRAKSIIDSVKNNDHQKVVIMFTDGEPNHSNGFSTTVANNAIKASKSIKDAGATVYTIGCFSKTYKDTENVPKYMNRVSSNYLDATTMRDGTKTSSDYYKTVSSAADLNNIFTDISQTIGGTTVTLGRTSVLRDVISDSFKLPAGADKSSIKAYSVDCLGKNSDGSYSWQDKSAWTAISPENIELTDNNKTINVTGFDYAANWVDQYGVNHSQSHGKKLVVQIPIVPETTAYGDCDTNGPASGIYATGVDGEEPVQTFPTPTVYIPYFTVTHVASTVDSATGANKGEVKASENYPLWCHKEFDLTSVVTEKYLYGGTFNEETCTTVHKDVQEQGNPMELNPTENATYYIWEVPDYYLRPANYYVWRHLPENGGKETVVRLYPLTSVDRMLYKEVGFQINGTDYVSGTNNQEFDDSVGSAGTAQLYQMVKAVQNGQPYMTMYVNKGKINATAVGTDVSEDKTVSGTPIDEGFIGGLRLPQNLFDQFAADTPVTYRPYWITQDGVKVLGVRDRTSTFEAGSTQPKDSSNKYAAEYSYVSAASTQAMSFAEYFTMDDSQPVVDESLTVTVVDGSNTTQVKVAPNGSVRDQVAYQAPAGKVFAGWFADQAYTIPADLDQVTEDTTIYAKYVSDSYLDLAYSRTGLFRLRGVTLISAVDNPANYQASGIMVNGQKLDVSYASRYRIFKTPANLFGAARDAKLMLADKSLSGTGTLEVTPYWITLDGTEVHGVTHTLHYNTRTIWE